MKAGVACVLLVPQLWCYEHGASPAPKNLTTQIKREIIMAENANTQTARRQPKPNPDLKNLNKLIGTWEVSGGVQGKVTFEWMEGGFFLVQHVDLEHEGRKIKGIEIIGHEQEFGAAPSEEIKTRFYSFLDGLTLDYVYESDGHTLTIWAGEKGSPAYMKGKFSDDGNSFSCEWVYPGGRYKATGTRVK